MSNVWELEPESPDWLPEIILRLLSADIPPTAIARAFRMSPEPIKEMLMDVRVEKYGTSELTEAYNMLVWRAFNNIKVDIDQASPSRRLTLWMMLISKVSAFARTQTPDMLQKIQGDLGDMFSAIRETDEPVVGSIYETVAADAPTDNPEERLTSRTTRPE